jgi:hypothetical protein
VVIKVNIPNGILEMNIAQSDENEVHDNMLTDDNLREEQNAMEENTNDKLVSDGIHSLIHATFSLMDEDASMDDDARIHDKYIIDLSNKSLYIGSKTSIFSSILFLVNLKVLNSVSNTFFT